MTKILPSKTVSVSIDRTPQDVYDYVSDFMNAPQWATQFCLSVKPSEDGWVIETPAGAMKVRMAERNSLGILDHYVSPTPETEVYAPMRVLVNGPGSEVIFTVFRQPGMTDEQFADDAGMVEKDLQNLKAILEGQLNV